MRVFVTGGTGLLGNTVIRKLCSAGYDVAALVRREPDPEVFEGLDVELVQGELQQGELQQGELQQGELQQGELQSVPLQSAALRSASGGDMATVDADPDPDTETNASGDSYEVTDDLLDHAIAGCDTVIHAAAMIHLGWMKMDESMSVNRDGTRRIVQACLRHGKKLVYIGTVNTIALGSRQMLADETTPLEHAGGQVECAYVKSKRASLEVIHEAVPLGLDAVIVHPGFMLGPWDWKPSSGRMMLEVGKGWKPVAPSGGCSLCDSRDVADGVISAMKSTCVSGREFILAGHNWTYQRLWTEMAKRMGTRPPIRAAGPGMEYLAGLAGDFWARVTGSEPDINSAGVSMSGQFHWYSSRRAQNELGYRNRDAKETLDAAAEWIRDRFVLPRNSDAS